MFFLAKLYRAVVKAVLKYGAETWILSDAMLKNHECVHVGFLQKLKCNKYRRKKEGYFWRAA